MEAFVHLAVTEECEFYFLPCVGEERAVHLFIFLTGPLENFASRFFQQIRGELRAAMKMNRRAERFGTQRKHHAPASAGSISWPGSAPSSTSSSHTSATPSSTSATSLWGSSGQ